MKPMVIVERLFIQKQPDPKDGEKTPRPLSDFFSKRAVVVLGDPGAGKTTCFRKAAQEEANAEFISVRDFTTFPANHWKNKTLYLDGLDEQRAKQSDGTAILDKIRGHLYELNSPSFRLSCRAADWYGSSDTKALCKVSSDQTVTVLQLESLTEEDILTIATDFTPNPQKFLEEARDKGIYELLINPQTLEMILKVVSEEGSLPDTRKELYERACNILCREENEEHSRAIDQNVSEEAILDAAGRICIVQLCCDLSGTALTQHNANKDFPYMGDLSDNQDELYIAARRKLFQTQGPERITPIHRTVAEYLAARYLAKLIQKGLPVGRALSLITGKDGGTLSDLRGLYGWLVCFCPEHAEYLIPKDPLGIVLYGDPSELSFTEKKIIVENLVSLSDRNPWFRAGSWAARPFSAIVCPEMEPVFRDILEDPSKEFSLVRCILDAIDHGKPLPGLCDSLQNIVQNKGRDIELRVHALKIIQKIHLNGETIYSQLLEDIHNGGIPDENNRLRAILLRSLYPRVIGPSKLPEYLVDVKPGRVYGEDYDRFLDQELVELTKPEDVPSFLDSILNSLILSFNTHHYPWKRVLGRLLLAGLSQVGEEIEVERLYHWLGITVDKYGFRIIEEDDSLAIHEWLETRPELIINLFKYWLTLDLEENLRYMEHKFQERLQRVKPPKGFGQLMLRMASEEEDTKRADFLFRQAVQLRAWRLREDAPTLEELNEFVEQFPQFCNALESELYCEIPEWRREDAMRKIEHEQTRRESRSKYMKDLNKNLAQIRAGTHVGGLNFLAEIYFGRFSDIDKSLEPRARLIDMTSVEVTSVALEGFVAALGHPQIPSPKEIGEGGHFPFGYVILAGMDQVAAKSLDELQKLPEETLKSALAFYYVNHVEPDSSGWADYILNEFPELAADALASFWQPRLAKNSDSIPGLYELAHRDSMGEVVKIAAPSLLNQFPDCRKQNLEYLLYGAFKHMNRVQLIDLVSKTLEDSNRIQGEQRVLWLTTAFLLEPEKLSTSLENEIGRDKEKVGVAFNFLWPIIENFLLPPGAVAKLILIGGRVFPPSERENGRVRIEDQVVERVRSLIEQLGNDLTKESMEELESLKNNSDLKAWSRPLLYNIEIQKQKTREAEFEYFTVDQVIETLNKGRPANITDLRALVMDHLILLKGELRHGSTDGYKNFWNVDQHGRPDEPRPENDCRDRILERIRPLLLKVEVNAEREGSYADDKRADIKVLFKDLNLPVEIKRHYHTDIWTAPYKQLQKRYMRDPGAYNHGIYLVIWFGTDEKMRLPKLPHGITAPKTPEDLEAALQQMVSGYEKSFIDVVVFDCSSHSK